MWRSFIRLLRSRGGAVAPTIALALAGLIAVGGIAFDYARLASMDTELQSAADQAALAAATQLDGEEGAVDRATQAAQNLVANLTYFANDGNADGQAVTVETITFYADYDPATGAKTGETSDDADANYVEVTVAARTANYALTPIVAAFSGTTTASAFATLDSAYCNLPPFMLCKPSADFDASAHIGDGLRLVIDATTAPGNFGFLQTGFGEGAENLAKAIGWNDSAGGCVAARGVVTEPGNKQSVRAALNTRFDMSESGQTCPAGGNCYASANARKDLVKGNNCSTSGNQGWSETDIPYRGNADGTPLDGSADPRIMGHPRDLCHAASKNGICSGGIIGDGNWDRNAFFRVNYGWDAAGSGTANDWTTKTGLPADVSRYQVYLWEFNNPQPNAPQPGGLGTSQGPFQVANGNGQGTTAKQSYSAAPVCRPGAVAPGNLDTDRRVMAVAVVDCTGLNGRDTVVPRDWVDVFLVEPTFPRGTGANARTGDGDVYVEIIGTRPLPGVNESIGEVIRRDVPRLIE
jgi:Flp pilus assembly protein TadG